ncbi:MAG: OmpA family protein [Myxococcota bacterium]
MKSRLTACLALGGAFAHGSALAQEASATGTTAATAAPSSTATEAPPAPAAATPLPPARFELGIFGGLFFPSSDHELLTRGPYQKYESPAPELGGRLSFLPLEFAGVEVEGAAMPTKTESGSAGAFWAARGHLILQLPLSGVTPFAVLGGGALGASSNALGSDNDPAVHFGLGGKVALDDFLSFRLDLRDTVTQKHDAPQGDQTHHLEATVGLSFSLRPGKSAPPPAAPPPPPPDTDGDGVSNDKDICPVEKGTLPNGCPVIDSDSDGVLDDKDACPKDAGRAPCGCPPVDSDGDKVIDELDRCPKEAGPVEGCPDPDADRDGVSVPEDHCPDKPETKNGYEDADGCPDEVPEVVKKFTGVIQGIEFDRGKETIRPVSTPILDAALKVLSEYPKLRVLISGHTDSDGARETNVDLSKRRAESVKTYFVSRGIDGARIETRGVGPDEPIADNKTAAGKQKNRRIEFKLIDEAKSPEKGQP